jgi:hypothetical protein
MVLRELPQQMELYEKRAHLEAVARSCRLPLFHWQEAVEKTDRGHREHHDADTIDLLAELRGELADIAGYGALCKWRGQWSWRLWIVVVLAGLQWRILGKLPAQEREPGGN